MSKKNKTIEISVAKKPEKKVYIAYGSNMSLPRMHKRCPHAEPLGIGWLNDYRLVFRKSKTGFYTSVDKAIGHKVPCYLWFVDENDEIKLDIAEGCPKQYKKYLIDVDYENPLSGKTETVEGIIYILPESRQPGDCTGSYFSLLVEGYNRFGIDMSYLIKGIEYTKSQERTWKKLHPAVTATAADRWSYPVTGKTKSSPSYDAEKDPNNRGWNYSSLYDDYYEKYDGFFSSKTSSTKKDKDKDDDKKKA